MKPRARIVSRVVIALGGLLTAMTAIALLAPVVLTIVMSFSGDTSMRFPPTSWGVDRYVKLFQSEKWLASLGLSVQLGLVASLLALVVSLAALQAILRSGLPLRSWLENISVGSLIIPVTAYAVAVYGVFLQFGWVGSFWGLALTHTMLAIPFVMIVGGIRLRALPIEYELVAITLGASRARAWFDMSVRIAAPSFLAGTAMAFLASFEEAVVVSFVGGSSQLTLPKRILDSLQWGSEPVVPAIASIITIVVSFAIAIPLAMTRAKESK